MRSTRRAGKRGVSNFHMDINKLKNKRQLNVQEQNALTKNEILCEAKYWRENGIPEPLEAAFREKGIDTNQSIYLQYEQDFPGVSSDEGIVLTTEYEFYEFELDLNKARTEVIEFYTWENITTKVEVNEHKPGSGATWGFLALQVLTELNQC